MTEIVHANFQDGERGEFRVAIQSHLQAATAQDGLAQAETHGTRREPNTLLGNQKPVTRKRRCRECSELTETLDCAVPYFDRTKEPDDVAYLSYRVEQRHCASAAAETSCDACSHSKAHGSAAHQPTVPDIRGGGGSSEVFHVHCDSRSTAHAASNIPPVDVGDNHGVQSSSDSSRTTAGKVNLKANNSSSGRSSSSSGTSSSTSASGSRSHNNRGNGNCGVVGSGSCSSGSLGACDSDGGLKSGGGCGAVMVIEHTFTPPCARGHGLAARLCDAAIDFAARAGMLVASECTYVTDTYLPRRMATKRDMVAICMT